MAVPTKAVIEKTKESYNKLIEAKNMLYEACKLAVDTRELIDLQMCIKSIENALKPHLEIMYPEARKEGE